MFPLLIQYFKDTYNIFFTLYDSGLDQTFINTLPVFMYKDVVGTKESFDCAVYLCDFCEMDKLILLPTCSHAFHIDTWLQQNLTCLCRNSLPNRTYAQTIRVWHIDTCHYSFISTSYNVRARAVFFLSFFIDIFFLFKNKI